MALLGDLVVRIVGDTAQFVRSIDHSGQKLNQFEKDLKKITDTMSRVGKKMTTFVTLPIIGIGAAFVKAAADAEEINSKFNVVYKEQAESVREWAKEFSQATGRANVDNIRFLASVQDLFVPLGIARDKAAELSKSVVTLSTDIGSFNNLPTADVLRDIESALVGNHETVRKYGVVLSEATINQELLNMGITGGYKAANAAEKAIARYNLIVAGTADAQGDAIRTSGSFTNQFRALKSSVKDLAEGFGTLLLPSILKLVQHVKDTVNWINNLDESKKKLIIRVLALAAAIGPALLIISKLIVAIQAIIPVFVAFNAVLAANPILAIVTAVALLGTAAYLLVKNWEKVAPFFKKVWNTIIDIFDFAVGPIIALVQEIINVAKEWLIDKFIVIAEGVAKIIDGIVTAFGGEAKAHQKITAWIDTWEIPARKRLNYSLRDLKVETEGASETLEKDFTPALEDTKEQADNLATSTENLLDKVEKLDIDLAEWISAQTEIVYGLGEISLAQLGLTDIMSNFIEKQQQAIEETNQQAESMGSLIDQYYRADAVLASLLIPTTDELQKRNQELIESYRAAGEMITGYASPIFEAFGQAIIDQADAAEILKEAFKNLIVGILRALGRKLAIMGAEALVPLPGLFNPAGAAAAFALSAAAYVAAGVVAALQEGGVTKGMTPAMLHPNEAVLPLDNSEAMGRIADAIANAPRPTVQTGEQLFHVMVNVAGKNFYDDISKASRDGMIIVDARNVR